ncbi:IclR family transcriptional regulator [Streptomyces sp. KM273126]|uniref:IclR family transcriptional regulator n=1 Tax=Streptomyces sp. KM273126 TaxID=2545247 RepID=UPI0014043180|nr:IclR family transcriptional regulator [Streptomyces sp. KM273126]MBA2813886.1 IclR family transcriptional regulator [Streptomyces sp. KM273126]
MLHNTDPRGDQPGAGILDRAMLILRYMATAHEATVADLAGAASTSRSTVYRLAHRLEAWGMLQPHHEPGRWVVGPEALRLGLSVLQRSQVAHVAPEPLRHLADLTQETTGLAVRLDRTMVFVHRQPGPRPSPVSARVGAVRPLHCTAVGKAWLAALPAEELGDVLLGHPLEKHTPATLNSRSVLERDLALVRRRGWSLDNGEVNTATAACGAVVLDGQGRPIAAISASGPIGRVARRAEQIGPVVASTAALISRRLGYQQA